MKFSRKEYWSGLSFPSPGDLPDPGIEPRSPALQADSLPSEPPEKEYLDFQPSPRPTLQSHFTALRGTLAPGPRLLPGDQEDGVLQGLQVRGNPHQKVQANRKMSLIDGVTQGARSLQSAHFSDSGSVTTHLDS